MLTVGDLLAADPIDPVETGEDDLALMQLTSGSTGSPEGRADHPPQHRLQRRGDVHRRRVRRRQRRHGQLAALLPRHGHDRLPDHPDVLRRRAGQGHADGLPARHPAVGQADRQVQGHHDGGAELRLRAVRQAAAQAGQARRVRPVVAAVRAVGRRAGRARRRRGPAATRASRSGCGPRRSCPPTAWPRRRWRCRSPSAAPAWWSTRSTPTCWPRCAAPCRPPRATPAGWPRSARC